MSDINKDPFEEMTDEVFAEDMIEEVREEMEPEHLPAATAEEKQWALFAHLSGLAGYILPLGAVIGPLVIWLMKKDTMPLVDKHGKMALNFQLSMLLYFIISIILVFAVIGVFLLIGLAIFQLVMIIMAVVNVSNDKEVKYPLSINFIK